MFSGTIKEPVPIPAALASVNESEIFLIHSRNRGIRRHAGIFQSSVHVGEQASLPDATDFLAIAPQTCHQPGIFICVVLKTGTPARLPSNDHGSLVDEFLYPEQYGQGNFPGEDGIDAEQ